MHSHPYNPELVSGKGVGGSCGGGGGGRPARFRLHRPSRADAALAAVRWARRPRPLRRDGLRGRPHHHLATDSQRRGAAVPQSVRGGQGGRDAGPVVRRPLHPRGGRRLPQTRIHGTRSGFRGARRPVRGGPEGHPQRVDRRRRLLRGQTLHRHRDHRAPQAGQQAAPPDLDRRQHRGGTAQSRGIRGRLVSVSRSGSVGADRSDGSHGNARRPGGGYRRSPAQV